MTLKDGKEILSPEEWRCFTYHAACPCVLSEMERRNRHMDVYDGLFETLGPVIDELGVKINSRLPQEETNLVLAKISFMIANAIDRANDYWRPDA